MYLDDCLQRKVLFFTGKGGVGKSTVAWGTALACRRKGAKVAVVAWRPLGKEDPPPLIRDLGVDWIGLETLSAFREYAVQIIRFQKLYDSVLDNKILRTFVLAAPGLADAVIAGKIWDLYNRGEYDTLVVDMPSSGHARSFFKSPLGLQKIFKVGFVARDTDRVCSLFASKDARLDLIALPEELPIVECRELKESLEPLHPFSFGFLHVNQCLPEFAERSGILDFPAQAAEQKTALAQTEKIGLPQVRTPRFASLTWKEAVENTAKHLEQQ